MSIRSMFMVGALCLLTVSLSNARLFTKTYDIHLYSPAVAGTVQLPAGDYKLKVDGPNAVLTDVNKNETYTIAVKIGTAEKKFDQTRVVTAASDGATHLKVIEIGGSTTRLEFGD
jgi:hypothetical protein